MEILASNKFQLIKRDIRALKKHIVYNNEISDWMKIIIIYNIYLIFSHLNLIYKLTNYFINNNNISLNDQYKQIFLFFFILCNIKNSYLYFILNVSKIDYNLANNLYSNSKEFFI